MFITKRMNSGSMKVRVKIHEVIETHVFDVEAENEDEAIWFVLEDFNGSGRYKLALEACEITEDTEPLLDPEDGDTNKE